MTDIHPAEGLRWHCHTALDKYEGEVSAALISAGLVSPYEHREIEGNILTYGGASALWERIIGNTGVAAFSNANAYIGVGDSSASTAASQTDLQAATNKVRQAMDATYPQHTDSTSSPSAASIVFRSTYGTSVANFDWNEWAIFNAGTGGRMLNRRVEALGTKTNAATWTLTLTLSLS